MTYTISEGTRETIVDRYKAGGTYREIAAEANVSLSTVSKVVHDAGLQGRPNRSPRVQGEDLEELVRRYKARESLASLSRRFNLTTRGILFTLRRAGVPANHQNRVAGGRGRGLARGME